VPVAEVANLDGGDIRTFEHGTVQTAKVGTITVSRATMESGWRWSSDVKPITGTDSCMVHHKGYAVTGRLHVLMDDGSEMRSALATRTTSHRATTPGSSATSPMSASTSQTRWRSTRSPRNSRCSWTGNTQSAARRG
jgi:hypothetical protein